MWEANGTQHQQHQASSLADLRPAAIEQVCALCTGMASWTGLSRATGQLAFLPDSCGTMRCSGATPPTNGCLDETDTLPVHDPHPRCASTSCHDTGRTARRYALNRLRVSMPVAFPAFWTLHKIMVTHSALLHQVSSRSCFDSATLSAFPIADHRHPLRYHGCGGWGPRALSSI